MRLPRITKNNRGRDIGFVAILGVAQAAMMMAAAFATRAVFQALSGGEAIPCRALGLLVLIPLMLGACQAMARIKAEHIGQSYAVDLRDVLFRAIAGLSPEARDRRSMGGLSLRFVGDLSAARGWAGLGTTRLISGAIVLPAAAVTLYLLNPMLALAGMAPIAVSMILFVLLGLRLKRVHKSLRKRRANVAIHAMERIAHARELALMGRLNRECVQLRKRGVRAAEDAVGRIQTTAYLRMIPNASLGLGSALILFTALSYGLPTGETAASLAVLAILTVPLRQLVGVWDKHAAWQIARGKCMALLNAAEPVARVSSDPAKLMIAHPDWAGPLTVGAGDTAVLPSGSPQAVADAIAALSGQVAEATVEYDTSSMPSTAVISAHPVILKGSLRRALTLGCRKRPVDEDILRQMAAFGIKDIFGSDLNQKVQENGQDQPANVRLRIACIQAILRAPSVLVVTADLWNDADARELLDRLRQRAASTVVVAPQPTPHPRLICANAA